MTDKQTTWADKFDNNFDLDNYGDSHIMNRKVKEFISVVIQEEREKVIAEFISGGRCSGCGKLITDGSSCCCKDCWENN